MPTINTMQVVVWLYHLGNDKVEWHNFASEYFWSVIGWVCEFENHKYRGPTLVRLGVLPLPWKNS